MIYSTHMALMRRHGRGKVPVSLLSGFLLLIASHGLLPPAQGGFLFSSDTFLPLLPPPQLLLDQHSQSFHCRPGCRGDPPTIM